MAERRIGYHASHEQHPPSDLLRFACAAADAGFEAAMCSDHFQPWSERQGHSGFAWAWLGAALASTPMSFGTVTAPGQRYHPVVVAQGAATLAELYPGRFWLALGSGEAMNELVVGGAFPAKDERNARLRESVDVIRALLGGETVTHRGLVTVEEARLWSLPDEPPPLIGAAITPETARWVGSWADGLITIARSPEDMRRVVDAFREGGGEGKPMRLQAQLSWARTDAEALANAHDQWRTNIFDSPVLGELRSPASFDAAASFVRPEDVDGPVRVSSDVGRHVAWLEGDLELGFERVYVHNVGRDQDSFIETWGREVLPRLG